MAYERIVALYDTAEKAHEAAGALEHLGFNSSDISVSDDEFLRGKDVRDSNIWQRLLGRIVSDQESTTFRRTITSGGAVLTLRSPDTEVDRAMKILNVHGRMSPAGTTASTQVSAAQRSDARTAERDRFSAGEEEVIRLAEEQINIGKRQVATGKSRIRRFVTEKPVEQQITLHEEHCEVARREVTDPKVTNDIDWKDRTIEITETAEQPVVTKTARIAEEVVVRRQGSDHIETVRDTVRRQQLEVERVADVKRDLNKAA